MRTPDNRNRFIPFRKADIVEMCVADGRLDAPERMSFRGFCRIFESLLHFEFHHLIDAAEEEEFKEAVLAYYFLLTRETDLTVDELDRVVEEWLAESHDCRVDFEIGDAVEKLERLGLVEKIEERLRPKDLDAAKEQLDRTWDSYFAYAK